MKERFIGKFFHLTASMDRRLDELAKNECIGQGSLLREGCDLILKQYEGNSEGENNDNYDSS